MRQMAEGLRGLEEDAPREAGWFLDSPASLATGLTALERTMYFRGEYLNKHWCLTSAVVPEKM